MPEISPADRFLPHPDEDWYDRDIGTTGGGIEYVFQATPEQRRSYVRYILAGHGGERSWELRDLADWEPESLAPWADAVTTFDDAALAQLTEVEHPDFWLAARGASDPAVDALADRIDADPSKTDVACARVELLTGVDTDRALARLADLGRRHPLVAEIVADHGIWVPPAGPAVRRYTRQPRLILPDHADPEPGLRVAPPVEEILADPRGTHCAWPLSIVLDVDLALLDGTALAGASGARRHPFIGSLCSDCEADEEMYDFRSWTTVDGKVVFDEERDESCPGNDPEHAWSNPTRLGLGRSSRYVRDRGRSVRPVGTLGGLPVFRQTPFWPGHCDKPMVYVGQTNQSVLGGFDETLYGFACECGAAAQVGQNT